MRSRLPLAAIALALVLTFGPATPGAACGPDTDCTVGERTYRIALPQGEGPFGAIVYLHGWRATAAGVMANEGLRAAATRLGVALIAPKSGGEDWLIRNAPRRGFSGDHRELAFFDAMLDDVAGRFPVDTDRILATGFSAGGMMTWTLACHRPDRFAAFLPVAGTFWAPLPETCEGPATLVHIHGMGDGVVPLAGRPIADTRQGSVPGALTLMRAVGVYEPTETGLPAGLSLACRSWRNRQGDTLALCLHEGGHVIRPEWVAWAFRTLVSRE
jgi:polyhydroxybutyrate depolymerase